MSFPNGPNRDPSAAEARMVRSMVEGVLTEALRYGSATSTFHGFSVQATRTPATLADHDLLVVSLTVRAGCFVIDRGIVHSTRSLGRELAERCDGHSV